MSRSSSSKNISVGLPAIPGISIENQKAESLAAPPIQPPPFHTPLPPTLPDALQFSPNPQQGVANVVSSATTSPSRNGSGANDELQPLRSLNEFHAEVTERKNPSPSQTTKQIDALGNEEDENEADTKESFLSQILPFTLRETPSWLVSMVVHIAIILLLALIPLSAHITKSISIISGVSSDPGSDVDLAVTEIESVEETFEDTDNATASLLVQSLEQPPVENVSPDAFGLSDLKLSLPIRNGLRGRSGGMKSALLQAYGGTALTEDAVASGLDWLARNQKSDGSWSLVGPYREGGVNENKPAATAMALLAFMGAGNTHQSGEYKDRVKSAINYVIRLQNREGFFADQAAGNQRTYAHAQCSIAICELYGMTGDEELRKAAQLSIRYAEKAQSTSGGWRYRPGEGGDTSVTGWYVMALISARMAGLDVDSEVLERVHEFLNTVQRREDSTRPDPEGELYAYQSYSKPVPSMTAEGMLCRLYLGWGTDDPRISQGAKHLAERTISDADGRMAYYYWYYATTTLHHIGGKTWTEWNDVMKIALPAMQIKTGKEKGSWPIGSDPHAATGGRLYATCMALFCLESYYRHLPLSEMAPTPTK